MKKISLLVLLCGCINTFCFAHHIVGGELYYSYVGPGEAANTSNYKVTLRLFRNCFADADAAPLPPSVTLGIFNNGNPYINFDNISVARSTFNSISLTNYPVCISTKPPVCYQVATYTKEITLEDNASGYIISFQTCCRLGSVNVIDNADNMSGVPGATYSTVIPGTDKLAQGHNSSAVFKLNDAALVCASTKFSLDFGSLDNDTADSLSYSFVAAYNGGQLQNASDQPPGSPPYAGVQYVYPPYTSYKPLGPLVSVDSKTGIISGIAPPAGPYVVCVEVQEKRNGIIISTHQKDFILIVSSCTIPQAALDPFYTNCGNFTFSFTNLNGSGAIHSYYWDFGDPASNSDTSTQASPAFTYADTGTYNVKLIVNKGEECVDSTITIAKVYPGFFPNFTVTGNCISEPYHFFDSTIAKYGSVNSWYWVFDTSFEDPDISVLQNPVYQYFSAGIKYIKFIAGSDKGCVDTVFKKIEVPESPLINLAFRDTLICAIDTLQLHASTDIFSSGYTFTWSPDYNVSNIHNENPFVSPKQTTLYYFSVDDHQGCANKDSVLVNVVDRAEVDITPDTTICATDSIQLAPKTNALYFTWSPSTGLNDPNVKDPVASPTSAITYTIIASIGKCTATNSEKIKIVPYPLALAFADTSVCFGNTVQIHGQTNAPFFTWSPSNSLLNPQTLDPIAGPQSTTSYVLITTDTLGCPKPATDTITVTVLPKVMAAAGNDTVIIANQPLQLNATGGETYEWTPSTGMNNPTIANPVVVLGENYDTVKYVVKVSAASGCFSTDSLKVIIFKTQPSIFVPSGFTPNGDGKNDILKPILVGMKQLDFFRVFNRWGNMLYSTSRIGEGWDGTFNGTKQASATYVFVAEAVNYLGKTVIVKGTVVLIR